VFAYGSYIILLHVPIPRRLYVGRASSQLNTPYKCCVFRGIQRTGVGNTIYIKCFFSGHITHTHTYTRLSTQSVNGARHMRLIYMCGVYIYIKFRFTIKMCRNNNNYNTRWQCTCIICSMYIMCAIQYIYIYHIRRDILESPLRQCAGVADRYIIWA